MKFLKYTALVFLIFSSTSLVYADNSFIFSTDPQSIPIGVMSSKINIQSASPVTETTYLVLTSSSPSGQFLTSSGNPQTASVYIASGDSNRAVYYKDSTAGDFVLTAVIENKAKSPIATITQHIFIGTPVSGSGNSDSGNATTTDETNQTATINSSSSATSAYSSPAPLSSTAPDIVFEISAGRDRLSVVGNNLLFQATATTLPSTVVVQGISWQWSFGDGTVGQGSLTHHTYNFGGDYNVVLNASYSDQVAVAMAHVHVVMPQVTLSRVDGGLSIANNSGAEINLEGWSFVSKNKSFVFPQDTLISPGKKITFADTVTGMGSDIVQLVNPTQKLFATADVLSASASPETSTVSLADIQTKINDVKTKLAQISPAPLKPKVTTVFTAPVVVVATSTENTATVFEAPKHTSIVSTIFSWPMRGFNFIKHLFVEN